MSNERLSELSENRALLLAPRSRCLRWRLGCGPDGLRGRRRAVLNNDVADAVTGTFAGLPNGANLAAGGSPFQIGYSGATGNDIVLTQLAVSAASSFSSIAKLGNGNFQLNGLGTSNLTFHVQASTNLATTNWVSLGTTTANAHGGFNFTDSSATNYLVRFYRCVFP